MRLHISAQHFLYQKPGKFRSRERKITRKFMFCKGSFGVVSPNYLNFAQIIQNYRAQNDKYGRVILFLTLCDVGLLKFYVTIILH